MAWIPAPPDDLNNHSAVREWMVAVQDALQKPSSSSGLPSGGADNDVLMYGVAGTTSATTTGAFWATPVGDDNDPNTTPSDGRGFKLEFGQGMTGETTLVVQQNLPVRLAVGAEPDDADINQQSISFYIVDAHDAGVTPYTFGVKYHTADGTFVTATLGTLT